MSLIPSTCEGSDDSGVGIILIGHREHFKPVEKRPFDEEDERSIDSIVGRLFDEARGLGRLEQRYDVVLDYIRQFNRTANSLAIQSGQLQRPSNPDPDGVNRIMFNQHRKILLEEARRNSSLRKISIAEEKWLRREIVEEQSTIRAMREKLVDRFR